MWYDVPYYMHLVCAPCSYIVGGTSVPRVVSSFIIVYPMPVSAGIFFISLERRAVPQHPLFHSTFYGGITMAFSKYYEDNCELTFDRIFGNSNFSTTGYASLDNSHYYKPDGRPENERDERNQHHEK